MLEQGTSLTDKILEKPKNQMSPRVMTSLSHYSRKRIKKWDRQKVFTNQLNFSFKYL